MEPPKVLLEHRLFNRREKQCYSRFLHHRVLPTSEPNWDRFIMQWGWHQVNSGVFFFFSAQPSPPLLFSMQTDSSVKEISVIGVVIAYSLAPSAMLALKHTLCVSGHSDCSLSLSLSPHHIWYISRSLPPSHCFLLCLLNVTYYFSTRQSKGSSDVKQRCQECDYWSMFVGAQV